LNPLKITLQKSPELVIAHIREQIDKGIWHPGQKLPSVVDLALSFGVGRSTVREALSALKAMGWLDIRHGGGTYISSEPPTSANEINDWFHRAKSLQEILEVRKVLETGNAALAAKHRNRADLEQLEQTLIRMEETLQDETLGEQADTLFHLQIARATQNTLLIQLMESLSRHIQETMSDTRRLWFFEEQATASRLLSEHRKIFQAIKEQDEALATELMKKHLLKVEKVLKKQLPV
jgi:GntR family transcriptional repressor for pyruvate dehydrogenase complex